MSAPNFKMVENRKYNEEEIRFVVSRDQARWDHSTIAKAFKQHFGEYWASRNFTRKQVQYIKNTYKPAPGVIPTYTGPIPEFTPSPEPEESPQPASSSSSSSAAGRRRRQAAGRARKRSASDRTPMNQTSPYWQTPTNQTPTHEQPASPAAGPSRKRQRTQGPVPVVEGGASGEGHVLHGTTNPIDPLGGHFDVAPEEGPAPRTASLDPNSPGMLLLVDDDGNDDNGNGNGAGLGLAPLPNYLDIHPNVPLQSIERHRSLAPGGGSTNAPGSGLPTPQHPQRQRQQPFPAPFPGLGLALPPSPQPLFPHPYTNRGAVARDDPHGVWYFDPHDTCQIRLGHRHDFGGGVWFATDACATMSLLAMRQSEGVGFMLGVAAAAQQIVAAGGLRHPDGRAVDTRDLMRQAALLVRLHVPAPVLDDHDDDGEGGFGVPDPADVAELAANGRGLPAGSFYDPFHRRVVRYGLSGRGGGAGGSSSARPSRQGTAAPPPPPPQARTRQRTATPRDGRPARQGTGAAGPSN
ncbi:hypothetical protein KVR01_010590 [Diaporthe batatas]|uniref:uncharacterized protein n=1 Tax=Diaporthe batatas TaxID=748121 RepID=UPI001D0382CA|nr:uncharacterized protein KVR01_010590 [Diaporthe batatas]KAG8159953.1 hypothetical protein KVR01_010590 [Diaporthe batatas]